VLFCRISAEEENLFPEGTFENPDNIILKSLIPAKSAAPIKITFSRNEGYESDSSVQIEGDDAGYGELRAMLSLSPGNKYTFSAMILQEGNVKAPYLCAYSFDSQEKPRIIMQKFGKVDSSDWYFLKGDFTVPEDSAKIRIGVGLSGTGSVWFDNVGLRMTSIKKDPSVLLQNGDFESGDENPDFWTFIKTAQLSITPSVVKDKAYSGKSSVCFQGSASAGYAECRYEEMIVLKPSQEYILSAYVMHEELEKAPYLSVYFFDSKGKASCILQTMGKGGSERWYKLTGKFKIPPDAGKCRIGIGSSSKGKLWIDHVELNALKKSDDGGVKAPDTKSLSGWTAQWIAAKPLSDLSMQHETFYIRKEFELSDTPIESYCQITGDNVYTLYVNGKSVHSDGDWKSVEFFSIQPFLIKGRNCIAVELYNIDGPGGVLLEAQILTASDKIFLVATDNTWAFSKKIAADWNKPGFNDTAWSRMLALGVPPVTPWINLSPFRPFQLLGNNILFVKSAISKTAANTGSFNLTVEVKKGKGLIDENYQIFARLSSGDITFDFPLSTESALTAWADNKIFTLTGKNLRLNPYMPPGKYEVMLYSPWLKFKKPDLSMLTSIGEINITDSQPQSAADSTTVAVSNGCTIIKENGTIKPFVTYWTFEVNPDNIAGFKKVGIHTYEVYSLWAPIESEYRSYDFQTLYNDLLTIVNTDNNARIILKLNLDAPAWFCRKYPGDVYTIDSGASTWRHSMFSLLWLEEADTFIKTLFERLQRFKFNTMIFSTVVMAAKGGEFQIWGEAEGMLDYSSAAQSRFQKYCEKNYKSIKALNTKWKTGYTSFDNIRIPLTNDLTGGSTGFFYQTDGMAQDYFRFLSDSDSFSVNALCASIKKHSGRKMSIGAYYGYVMETGVRAILSGHLGIGAVLESSNVDFLCGPSSYGLRRTDNTGALMQAVDSTLLHGKAYISEEDIRSHLYPYPSDSAGPRLANLFESINVSRRQACLNISKNVGSRWLSLAVSDWFKDDDLRRSLGSNYAFNQMVISKSPQSRAEILVLVDEESMVFVNRFSDPVSCSALFNDLISVSRSEIQKSGAPFDVYLLSDLARINASRYKLVFILNAFNVTGKKKADLDILKSANRTVVWLYGSGLLQNGVYNTDNVAALTGISVQSSDELKSAFYTITQNTSFTVDSSLKQFGYGKLVTPAFFIDDSSAEVLGQFTENKKPALARKKFASWMSVVLCSPRLNSDLIRALAEQAGVHIYARQNDGIYVNSAFAGYYAITKGEKTITLPGKYTVIEYFSGRTIGENINSFTDSFRQGETKAYFYY